MHTVYILRGLPGSGKSTFVKSHSHNTWGMDNVHISADKHMVDADGNYAYDVTKLRQNHQLCRDEFYEALRNCDPLEPKAIYVDNTNMEAWEYQAYMDMVHDYNHEPDCNARWQVFVLTVHNHHNGKSIHDVPDDKVQFMASKYELNL